MNMSGRLQTILDQVVFFDRQLVYIISLIASLGSLSASMIYGWDTFTLSVAQRILMYPIVLISGLSILFNKEELVKYILALSIPGMAVSLYHHLNVRLDTLVGCGFALPCNTASRIVIHGYTLRPMYLPLLAFIAFSLITIIILLNHKPEVNNLKEKINSWI